MSEFALPCSEVARVDSIGSVWGKEEKQVLEASKYSSFFKLQVSLAVQLLLFQEVYLERNIRVTLNRVCLLVILKFFTHILLWNLDKIIFIISRIQDLPPGFERMVWWLALYFKLFWKLSNSNPWRAIVYHDWAIREYFSFWSELKDCDVSSEKLTSSEFLLTHVT